MTTIATVGSGAIGTTVASAALGAGYDVVLSNSRGPESLDEIVVQLGAGARAADISAAVSAGDLVLVATPVRSHAEFPPGLFAGKVVLDACNYYPHRDGDIVELLDDTLTSSGRLQSLLPGAIVVKAFNIINAAEIISTASPTGTPGRRALPIAGDDAGAKALVASFIDTIGFDVIDVGPLSESWRIQPRTPGYIVHSTASELRERVAGAERPLQPHA